MLYLVYSDTTIAVPVTRFPAGELQITFTDGSLLRDIHSVELRFESSDDIIALHLLADLLESFGVCLGNISLVIPYFPSARQDRQELVESFGLRVYVELIKNFGFKEIVTYDPHSPVLAGMFKAGQLTIMPQAQLLAPLVQPYLSINNAAIVSPDRGATKKTEALQKLFPDTTLLQFDKRRDYNTGKIAGIYCSELEHFHKNRFTNIVVVDDICDGGATFTAIGWNLRTKFPSAILVLAVTHGLFTKGTDELNKYYDHIVYYFNPKEPVCH
jgi:ribose-phosphate pyrophosphokinase